MLQTWLAYIIIILLLGTILFVIRRYELNKKKRETEERIKRERERILLQEAELKVKTAQARTLAAEAEKEMEKYNMINQLIFCTVPFLNNNDALQRSFSQEFPNLVSQLHSPSVVRKSVWHHLNVLKHLFCHTYLHISEAEANRSGIYSCNDLYQLFG